MRLLIVGTLKGQLTTATKIAMDRGASVTHAESIDQALAVPAPITPPTPTMVNMSPRPSGPTR